MANTEFTRRADEQGWDEETRERYDPTRKFDREDFATAQAYVMGQFDHQATLTAIQEKLSISEAEARYLCAAAVVKLLFPKEFSPYGAGRPAPDSIAIELSIIGNYSTDQGYQYHGHDGLSLEIVPAE